MSIDATNWAWSLQNISSTEKLVLLAYADRAGETHEAWPAWSRLIKDTCLDRKTIYKVLTSLQEKGLMIKTGEKKRQVFVYRLVGVVGREEKLSTTSTKNGTGSNIPTSTKNGTGTSTKNGTGTSTKNGTQNHQLNPKRNHHGKTDPGSVLLPIKNQVKNKALETSTAVTPDLIAQVEFYVEANKDKEPADKMIKVALSLIRKNKWNEPSGYKDKTSKSRAAYDKIQEREKQLRFQEEAKAGRAIRAAVLSNLGAQTLNELLGREKCQPA